MKHSDNFRYPDCRRAIRLWIDAHQVSEIAAELGITSRRQIYNVLRGKSKNFVFLERLIERAEANKRLYTRARELERADSGASKS